MRYPDITIKSVGDLLDALRAQTGAGEAVWFRGHGVAAWELVPSLARNKKHLPAELALYKRFVQNAVPHMPKVPVDEYEWMFVMQHHRAPTRLLDWSESPLTALYFAVNETKHKKQDAAVWCLDPVALNVAANLKQKPNTQEIPAFGIDDVLDNYLPSRVDSSPAQMRTVAIMGPRNTPRMNAQLGVFTINHREHASIETIGAAQHAWRLVIPAASKAILQNELTLLGFTALTLFPELDRVADVAKELLK